MFLPHRVRHPSHVFILLGCSVIALALPFLLDLSWPGFLEPVELWTVDWRFQLRPALPVSQDHSQTRSDTLVAIDYDDRAAREYGLGRWPWAQRVHAQVIDWLKEAGARTVVVDLLAEYPARDPGEDDAQVNATRCAGNVIYPIVFRPVHEREGSAVFSAAAPRYLLQAQVEGTGEIPGASDSILPLPALVEAARGLGHMLRTPHSDGVLHRMPLLYAVKGEFMPSLALAAAFRHMDVDPTSLRIERGTSVRLKPRMGEEVVVRIDAHGRAWINYAGSWGQRFLHYPYSWLLRQLRLPKGEAQLPAWFKDKSVVVLNLTTGSGDQGATPFERDFPFGEVHLHLLNMLLT